MLLYSPDSNVDQSLWPENRIERYLVVVAYYNLDNLFKFEKKKKNERKMFEDYLAIY